MSDATPQSEQSRGDELDEILPCVCGANGHYGVHFCPRTYKAALLAIIAEERLDERRLINGQLKGILDAVKHLRLLIEE